jgi:hypothetical protein
MKIAFRTNNTIKQHLRIKQRMTDKYNLCGVCKMNCGDCELKYVGQTRCTFRTRYKEYIREIKTNGQKSKYAQHILDTIHEYGKIEQIMEILHLEKKTSTSQQPYPQLQPQVKVTTDNINLRSPSDKCF